MYRIIKPTQTIAPEFSGQPGVTLPIKVLLVLLFTLFVSDLASAQGASLTAQVDRKDISIDETFNLTLRYSGKTASQPDFTLLDPNFNIRNQSSSSQTSIINGKVEATTEWRLLLEPKREGKLLIPAFSVEGAVSEAIAIEVSPPEAVPEGKLRDIFLETEIKKDSAYVQEQVLVTYRLYFAVGVDSLDVERFNMQDVVVEALPETIYQRKVSGKNYRVAEYTYAFFPQNSGELEIPALTWRVGQQVASDQRDFFGRPLSRTQVKRLRTEGKTIEVKPKPADYPTGAVWLPANNLKLSETWSSEDFHVGEPVTRNLTTVAEGLRVEQLPNFLDESKSSDRVRFYADQPQTVDDKNAQGFVAKRVESAAVVVNSPGQVTIPGIRVPWWDVDEDKLKYASVPARTVTVSGSGGNGSGAATPVNQSTTTEGTDNLSSSGDERAASNPQLETKIAQLEQRLVLMQILLGLSLVAALVLGLLVYLQKRKPHAPAPAQQTLRGNADAKILKACEQQPPNALRNSLLLWAQQRWPESDVQTLVDIARLSGSDELKRELIKLDKVLFAGDRAENWKGGALAEALRNVMQKQKQERRNSSDLAELY